jgi:uncharacterized protein (DUF983 family)
MTHNPAAARAAALLRQLDASLQQRDDLRHAPHCSGGPLVTQKGYSVTVTRCETCGAQVSVRHGAS